MDDTGLQPCERSPEVQFSFGMSEAAQAGGPSAAPSEADRLSRDSEVSTRPTMLRDKSRITRQSSQSSILHVRLDEAHGGARVAYEWSFTGQHTLTWTHKIRTKIEGTKLVTLPPGSCNLYTFPAVRFCKDRTQYTAGNV